MTEAPEPAAEPTEISEPDFTEIAMGRMAESFPELFAKPDAPAETPAEPDAPAEPEAEAQVETQAETDEVRRNAAGRAIGADGKFIPEPGEQDAPPEADPPPTDPAILAAQQAAYEANQRAAALEQQMQQLQAGVNQRLTMPPDQLASLLEDDPRQAAYVARNQGDLDTMYEAINLWADEGGSATVEASAFRADVDHARRMWEAQQQHAADQAASAPPAQRDVAPIAAVLKAHPDLPGLQPQMDEVVIGYPLLRAAIQSGEPQVQADALQTLYDLTKARHTDAVTADAQQAATAQQAEQAAAARSEAAVVSATQNGGSDTPLSFADQIRSGFVEAAITQGHMARPTS